jgi:hypothetical protein
MKNSKLLSSLAVASAAFFIACAPVAAQWQVPEHSIAIGRGTGTGFNSVAPGPNGSLLQSQGVDSDPAYTTFPLAMLGLCGTEFSFPVYDGAAWKCSTSSAPLAAVLNGTLNLNPLAASTQRGLNVTTSGPSSGSVAGSIYNNLISGSFNTTLTGAGSPGSPDCACWSLFQVSASTGASFDGVESYGLSVGNVLAGANPTTSDLVGLSAGVYTNFAYGGNLYGATSAATADGAGSVRILIGHEIGVAANTATGVPVRYGLNVDNYGSHTATGMDTAISIMGGAAGGSWKNGIVFTNPGNALAPALATSGKMMAAEAAMTVSTIFDFSNVTATNYILNGPHGFWTGNGGISLGDNTVAGAFSQNGPAATAVFNVVQQASASKWTYGITTVADWAINNIGLAQVGFKINVSTNIPSFPALNAAGAVCNNSSGDLSTSTTGCPGVTLAAASGGTGRATLTANAFLTGGGTSPVNMVAITGLVLGNGAGAPAAYAGTSCTNQFPRSLNASGVATCANVALGTDVSGTLGASNGGAGTISGALKGNGSGVVSQAASSDLSDATAWTAYTPAIACNNMGSGTWTNVFGRYKVLANKTVHITVTATLSAVGSCAGGFTFTIPNTAANQSVGYYLSGRETGTTGNLLAGAIAANGTAISVVANNAGPPLGAGSIYTLTGTYEIQ